MLRGSNTSSGLVFIYDVTKAQSWKDSKTVIDWALEEIRLHPPDKVKGRFLILGCKCDLVKEREVYYATVKEYADRNDMMFMETSAKENVNVEYAFVSFVAQILETARNYSRFQVSCPKNY